MPQVDYSIVSSLVFWTSLLFIIFYCTLVCFILPFILFLLKIRNNFILTLVFYRNYLNNYKLISIFNIYKWEFINEFYKDLVIIINIWPVKESITLKKCWFYTQSQHIKTKLLFLNLVKVFKLESLILKKL